LPNLSTHLRARIGKVCVAITGATAAEMIEKAAAAAKETPFLEFRLDYLDKPAAALPKLKSFLAEHTEVTAVGTCRRAENGGKFEGSVAAELDILIKAATPAEGQTAFQIVDLELESAETLKKGDLAKLRETGVALIVSHHNFKETKDLDGIYARVAPFEPDFVKIVPTAKTLTDNVTLMRFIERISDVAAIVGICMGDAGIISRVLGLRAGSAFTFAAATTGEETGPGQIAARTLVETYRIEEVDAATKVYGVAGNPVNKSLSPIMMNTAFRRETVNAVYLALQTAKIEDLVSLIGQIPIHGVSVTMPHKQAILPHLEHMDPLSQKIGACNTVLRTEGKLYGFNTDVAGIVTPLAKRLPLHGAKVLVLGAGGSARAAVFGLREKGADLFILNRTPETAAKLAKQSGAKVIKREAVPKTTFDVILNATPVGMAGQKAAQILTVDDLKTKFVFDLVYNPIDTPLIRMARQAGIPVITGVEMFVQQGARQFEIWTGKPAPEEEMLRVVVHALKQQAEAAAAPHPAEPAKVAKIGKAS
jgi:3-dehydroquinate dehydratase/shikimate dehydrogenase